MHLVYSAVSNSFWFFVENIHTNAIETAASDIVSLEWYRNPSDNE
jgi:hypothetical protein